MKRQDFLCENLKRMIQQAEFVPSVVPYDGDIDKGDGGRKGLASAAFGNKEGRGQSGIVAGVV